jgi:uncharacterized protein (DUF2147 family)
MKIMKKQFLLLVLAGFFGFTTFAQGDKLLGVWLNQEGTSHIEITKDASGQFIGKIVWLKDPLDDSGRPKLDVENPDKNLKSRPLLNLEILKGFKFNEKKKEWTGGTIYDPKNGKTYKAYMKLDDDNTLSLRGYVGIRALGRTSKWTRVK